MSKKVKKTLPGFASSMSGGNMDVLKKIVKNHYKELQEILIKHNLQNVFHGMYYLQQEIINFIFMNLLKNIRIL